jgi:hypothetical protein
VNHLLFADDSLLLVEANGTSAAAINSILQIYEECSGQAINREKSSVMFSANTPRQKKETIMQCLGLGLEAKGGKYLGLPLYVERSKAKCFEFIREKIWKRIQGWKERFLSAAGKELLLKAVAQAIPTYDMACFDLTKSLCDSISQMVCRYWWSQQDNENRLHWIGWEKMKLSKAEGGLGFRDLHSFNIAMLARQGWRLLQAPDSLCFKVLSAKYFPEGDLLKASPVTGMSYVWRSILKGIQLLKAGLIWRVDDGKRINIWCDPWLPKGEVRTPLTRRGNSILTKVSELIDPVTGAWDSQLVEQTFNEADAAAILSIPIVEDVEDYCAWHPDNRGKFTVKSAYKLHVGLLHRQYVDPAECANEEMRGWRQQVWKKMWKVECPPKVHHFLWRFGHNSHPLRMNIARKGVDLDTRCVVCNRLFEDGGHLFFRCKGAKAGWRALDLEEVRVRLSVCSSPLEVLELIFALSSEARMKSIAFLWCWWRERNKANHQDRRLSTNEIQFTVVCHCEEWKEQIAKKKADPVNKVQQWIPPGPEVIKINLDGAFMRNPIRGGWGAVGRNQAGEPVFAACGSIPSVSEALQAELMALINTIPIAEQFGLERVIFSTDCEALVQGMKSSELDLSWLGPLFKQARFLIRLAFPDSNVVYCPRACNRPADKLAALGVMCNTDYQVFGPSEIPPDVMAFIAKDLVIS